MGIGLFPFKDDFAAKNCHIHLHRLDLIGINGINIFLKNYKIRAFFPVSIVSVLLLCIGSVSCAFFVKKASPPHLQTIFSDGIQPSCG